MCILVIRVADKSSPDDPLRNYRTGRGDVIDVVPDGHAFSKLELENVGYRFVQLTGVDPITLVDMLLPLEDANGKLLLKRARRFDLDAVSSIESRLPPGEVFVVNNAQRNALLAAKLTKPNPVVVIG